MKQHPLHSIEFITSCLLSNKEYPGLRRTGRTTADALRLISEAIKRPGVWMKIQDHHGTPNADINMKLQMQSIIRKLELEYFTFKGTEVCFGA